MSDVKITLRKAAKIRSGIEKELAKINLATTVNVPVYGSYVNLIHDARRDLTNALMREVNLTDILIRLRTSIAAANVNSGLSVLITERALKEKLLKRYADLKDAAVFVGDRVESRQKVAQSSAGSTSRYGSAAEDIRAEFLNAVDIEGFETAHSDMRRTLAALSDRIEEKNSTTSIQVSNVDLDYLTKLNII